MRALSRQGLPHDISPEAAADHGETGWTGGFERDGSERYRYDSPEGTLRIEISESFCEEPNEELGENHPDYWAINKEHSGWDAECVYLRGRDAPEPERIPEGGPLRRRLRRLHGKRPGGGGRDLQDASPGRGWPPPAPRGKRSYRDGRTPTAGSRARCTPRCGFNVRTGGGMLPPPSRMRRPGRGIRPFPQAAGRREEGRGAKRPGRAEGREMRIDLQAIEDRENEKRLERDLKGVYRTRVLEKMPRYRFIEFSKNGNTAALRMMATVGGEAHRTLMKLEDGTLSDSWEPEPPGRQSLSLHVRYDDRMEEMIQEGSADAHGGGPGGHGHGRLRQDLPRPTPGRGNNHGPQRQGDGPGEGIALPHAVRGKTGTVEGCLRGDQPADTEAPPGPGRPGPGRDSLRKSPGHHRSPVQPGSPGRDGTVETRLDRAGAGRDLLQAHHGAGRPREDPGGHCKAGARNLGTQRGGADRPQQGGQAAGAYRHARQPRQGQTGDDGPRQGAGHNRRRPGQPGRPWHSATLRDDGDDGAGRRGDLQEVAPGPPRGAGGGTEDVGAVHGKQAPLPVRYGPRQGGEDAP